MLKSLRIRGFRRYDDFSFGGMGQINIILGNNNVGKTSLLEAVYAWTCGTNVPLLMGVPLSRGRYGIQNAYWMLEELLAAVGNSRALPLHMSFEGVDTHGDASFFHEVMPSDLLTSLDSSYNSGVGYELPRALTGDEANTTSLANLLGVPQLSQPPVRIASWRVNDGKKDVTSDVFVPMSRELRTEQYRSAQFVDVLSHIVMSQIVQMYAVLKRERLLQGIAEEMREVFPEIEGFDIMPYPDMSQAPVSVMRADGTMLPIYAYGDGVQKWFYLLGLFTSRKDSIVCVDEIDSGFHPGAQRGFCTSLAKSIVRNRVQLFATTHNIEFVDSLLEAIAGETGIAQDAVRVITLREHGGDVMVRNMSAEEARAARDTYNLELR